MPEPLWKSLARRFGMEIPPEVEDVSPEQQELYDEIVRRQQAEDPIWKKAGRGLVNTVGGAVEGMLGYEPNPARRDIGDFTNLGTQGITGLAGLPYAAYKSLRKGIPLTHGTQRKPFELFDPDKYDKNDILGWMTHAAENPEYSGGYAMGKQKSSTHIPETGPFNLQGTNYRTGEKYIAAPRMIPIEPEAKNVLDLVDPNPDDMSAALAAVNPEQRKSLIAKFKDARVNSRAAKELSATSQDITPALTASGLGIDPRHIKHRGNELSYDELPTRVLSEKIRMTPEDFDRSQFDAIRYNDMSEKSWAFPRDTPLNTPYGLPLNDPPKKIDMFKMPHDAPSIGTLEPTMDWIPPDKLRQSSDIKLWNEGPNGIPTIFGKEMNLDTLNYNFKEGLISEKQYKKAMDIFQQVKEGKIDWAGTAQSGMKSGGFKNLMDQLDAGVISPDEYTQLAKKFEKPVPPSDKWYSNPSDKDLEIGMFDEPYSLPKPGVPNPGATGIGMPPNIPFDVANYQPKTIFDIAKLLTEGKIDETQYNILLNKLPAFSGKK